MNGLFFCRFDDEIIVMNVAFVGGEAHQRFSGVSDTFRGEFGHLFVIDEDGYGFALGSYY